MSIFNTIKFGYAANNICLPGISNTSRVLSQVRCMSQIKKRITRLPSDTEVHQEEIDDNKLGPNDSIPLNLVNRNPRNLEQLSVEQKPLGYSLEAVPRTYWNKIVFEKSGKYLTGRVVHNSGRTLVEASTSEEAYREQSDSVSDTVAAQNIGTILARRCIESGVLFVSLQLNEGDKKSHKAMRDTGVKLREPDMIFPRRLRDL